MAYIIRSLVPAQVTTGEIYVHTDSCYTSKRSEAAVYETLAEAASAIMYRPNEEEVIEL